MSRSSTQSRNPAALPNPLQRDLARYALAAGAAGVSVLALAQPTEAEVVYTQVHQTIGRSQNYAIDLNHDGIVDFTIQNLFEVNLAFGYPYSSAFLLQALPAEGNAVEAASRFHTNYAAPLQAGVQIGPPALFKLRHETMAGQFGVFGTFYYFGYWLNVSNRYLGFHFKIDDEWHYGWARLTVQSNKKRRLVAVLTGYAYETEPDKPIIAGDTGTGNTDRESVEPTSEMFTAPASEAKPATFGALALGAGGLAIWRHP